jgi:hypothetical protein
VTAVLVVEVMVEEEYKGGGQNLYKHNFVGYTDSIKTMHTKCKQIEL